ncbi:DUF2490 domain-containing protein [Fibrella forsythiae]|uniref:DUF2490 domain-containing protein n=1 Tax=Fibrella forsythiae TaxID=2817061 RepID=A0ABS3JP06_9BACT|nr:DUF2490 domain-containing protein [Fibrella forsythiae]MBO0951151.1 DUF2490 domain-containing protein [Fibrella forsythiae]
MKNWLQIAASCLLLIGLSIPSTAQTWTFYGVFPQYSQTGSVTKRLGYNLFLSSTSHATSQAAESPGVAMLALQYYAQPSLTYKVTDNIQVGVGYAYVRHNLFGIRVNENRLWAQTVLSHDITGSRIKMSHRLRYEERYPLRLSTEKWSLAQLGRYHVGATIPFFDPKQQKTGWYAALSNEAFFCFSGAKNSPISSKNAFYGENWTYGGVGYNTGKWGKIEVGYQYQNLIRNAAQDHRNLHLLQIQWATNFSLDGLTTWLLTPPF